MVRNQRNTKISTSSTIAIHHTRIFSNSDGSWLTLWANYLILKSNRCLHERAYLNEIQLLLFPRPRSQVAEVKI